MEATCLDTYSNPKTIVCLHIFCCECLEKHALIDQRQGGFRVGAVVRALASHQCVPGSILGPGVICGLSLICWFSTLLREIFLRELRFSPLLKNQHLSWFDLFDLIYLIYSLTATMIWDFNEVIVDDVPTSFKAYYYCPECQRSWHPWRTWRKYFRSFYRPVFCTTSCWVFSLFDKRGWWKPNQLWYKITVSARKRALRPAVALIAKRCCALS